MSDLVGYLIKREDVLLGQGQRGVLYDYVLAGNGVWIEAEGNLLGARVLVAPAQVRGLAPMERKVILRHGRIPQGLWDLALDVMLADPDRERYVAITWEDDRYHIHVPEQKRSAGGISEIQLPENRVVDLHSHCGLSAYFSGTDNGDEQGFQLYVVVGKLDDKPVVRLRVGIYGHFQEVPWDHVFSGQLVGARNEEEEVEVEEVFWWEPGGLAKILARMEWQDAAEREAFLKMTGQDLKMTGQDRI